MTTKPFNTVNIELQEQPFIATIEIFECVLNNDIFAHSKDSNGPQTYVKFETKNLKVT